MNWEQFNFQPGEIRNSDLEDASGIIQQLQEILGVLREEARKLPIFNSGLSLHLIDATFWLLHPSIPNLDDAGIRRMMTQMETSVWFVVDFTFWRLGLWESNTFYNGNNTVMNSWEILLWVWAESFIQAKFLSYLQLPSTHVWLVPDFGPPLLIT
jgi:hypothetical protein